MRIDHHQIQAHNIHVLLEI